VTPQAEARFAVRQAKATLRDFARLYFAAGRQPEFRRYGGAFLWALYPSGVLLAYLHACRHGIPDLILVERGGRLLSGCMITRSGWLTNGVALGRPPEKRAAMRLLNLELRRYLARPEQGTRSFFARIDASNEAMVRGMRHLGFVPEPTPCYIITLPLGPLTISWYASRAPSQRWLRSDEHLVLRWQANAQNAPTKT
jgi:hypothetical protein